MTSSEDDCELLVLLRGLRASDRSVLVASLETPESQIATVAGSPKYVFWSKLQALGFATEMPLEIDLPPAARHILPRSFALTELGRRTLPEVLKRADDLSGS